MPFGDRLKKCREEKGLTQDDIADFFGEEFTRQAVSKWERGEAFPETDKLLRLAVKLDISLDELLADELVYYRKGKDAGTIESSYPGLVAGLKTLANSLDQYK